MNTILTIAGSDCSGGAGIQADIKTITVHGMYALSVITALTAQNTTGVYGIQEATPEFTAKQLDCVFTDIFPDAVKIGMVSNSAIIEVIVRKLSEYGAKNVVIDPVMVATSGGKLLGDESITSVIRRLLPAADIITPNIPEAQALTGIHIENEADMETAAIELAKTVPAYILIKGGHLRSSADDLLYASGKTVWIRGVRLDNPNTHGTGCTLSSAIACNLAAGFSPEESVRNAKDFVSGALAAGLVLGKGRGPLTHMYRLPPPALK